MSIVHEINSSFGRNPTVDVKGVFLNISKVCDEKDHEGLVLNLGILWH